MARPKTTDTRKQVSLTAELAERIRRFRFRHEFETEAQAIRTLLEQALDADERSK